MYDLYMGIIYNSLYMKQDNKNKDTKTSHYEKYKDASMKWRKSHPEEYRAYQREYHNKYSHTPDQIKYRQEYEKRPETIARKQTPEYKQKQYTYHKKYNKKRFIKKMEENFVFSFMFGDNYNASVSDLGNNDKNKIKNSKSQLVKLLNNSNIYQDVLIRFNSHYEFENDNKKFTYVMIHDNQNQQKLKTLKIYKYEDMMR